jgi:hypothetical protein
MCMTGSRCGPSTHLGPKQRRVCCIVTGSSLRGASLRCAIKPCRNIEMTEMAKGIVARSCPGVAFP